MLMSINASPPISMERLSTLYPSLLQKVSLTVSYDILCEPFLVLISCLEDFSLVYMLFSLSASGEDSLFLFLDPALDFKKMLKKR